MTGFESLAGTPEGRAAAGFELHAYLYLAYLACVYVYMNGKGNAFFS